MDMTRRGRCLQRRGFVYGGGESKKCKIYFFVIEKVDSLDYHNFVIGYTTVNKICRLD